MPDGRSTVRIGYSFSTTQRLSFRGSYSWTVTLPPADRTPPPPSVDGDGQILVGNGSELLAVDPVDGSVRWAVTVASRITTQPVIPQNGVIYVGSIDGSIYRFSSGLAE
jgi:outer membrane protein assembly factor BamB